MPRSDATRTTSRQAGPGPTTGRAIGAAAAILLLAAAGLGIGYWIASARAQMRIAEIAAAQTETGLSLARVNDRLAQAEEALAALRAEQAFLQTKSQILSLIVLFNDAERQVATADPEDADTWSDYQGLADRLFNVVTDLDARSASGDPDTPIRVRLDKGPQPTLTFEQDESIYPLPDIFASAPE